MNALLPHPGTDAPFLHGSSPFGIGCVDEKRYFNTILYLFFISKSHYIVYDYQSCRNVH